MLRRRSAARRGLGGVGTVARTAVIAGTATAVSNSVGNSMAAKAQQKQQAQAADRAAIQTQADIQQMQEQLTALQAEQAQAAIAPSAPAATGGDLLAQLQQLADLKTAGMLNDAEFESAKARILGG